MQINIARSARTAHDQKQKAGVVYDTFNVQGHRTPAQAHRTLRAVATSAWRDAVAAA
jgi:hypothetical protein